MLTDWFRNFAGQSRGVLNSNQYGGVIGGPIKKDKFFFFGSLSGDGPEERPFGLRSLKPHLAPDSERESRQLPRGWSTLGQCDLAAQAFVPAFAEGICAAKHPMLRETTTSIAGGISILCPSSGIGGPLYNINPVAISILQLKLPNGS